MKIKLTLLQGVLCLLLLCMCVVIISRQSARSVQTGAFGKTAACNDTLEDFSCRLFSVLFYD